MQRHSNKSVMIDGEVITVDQLHEKVQQIRNRYTKKPSAIGVRDEYLESIRIFTEAKKLTGYCPNCKEGREGMKEILQGRIKSGALKIANSVGNKLKQKAKI